MKEKNKIVQDNAAKLEQLLLIEQKEINVIFDCQYILVNTI